MKIRIVVFFIVIAIFNGRGTFSMPEMYAGDQEELVYMNSDLFDKDLSRLMELGHDKIKVTLLKKIDVNNIPERLDKWFHIIYGNE